MKSSSPTAGMNIAERILHVGGRNNAAGYIEFGSIQAVQALVRQVLRDQGDVLELYGYMTKHSVTGQQFFHKHPELPFLDNRCECIPLYKKV